LLGLPFTNIPFTQPNHWPTVELAPFAHNKDQAVFSIPLQFSIVQVDYSWLSLIFAISGFAEKQVAKTVKIWFFRHGRRKLHSKDGKVTAWNLWNLLKLNDHNTVHLSFKR